MNDTPTGLVENLITERIGLRLRPRQCDALRIQSASRISALHLRDVEEYWQLLSDGGPVADAEWQYLASLLTNNESYFFRDKGQIALLREQVLPELIKRNESKQTLRVWSAGCSTGEEAYTLSMLIAELIPKLKLQSWQITITGTDIDSNALNCARRGIYGSWSFRMVDSETKRHFFRHEKEGWKILESIQSSVDFRHCNLVADDFPNTLIGLSDMDLILCRNVFIYFEPKAVVCVLDKFAKTLSEGGYLLTGHVEARGLVAKPYTIRTFSETVIYQKGGPAAEEKLERIQTLHSPSASVRIRALPAGKVTKSSTIAPSVQLDSRSRPELEGLQLDEARSLADLGKYVEAVECCQGLLLNSPFSAEPYELLASIAQEQGRNEDAKTLLKKALYLSPGEAHFYMELGALYGGEGDAARAHKMRASALELLRRMPPEDSVGFSGGSSARECIQHLTEMSGEGA